MTDLPCYNQKLDAPRLRRASFNRKLMLSYALGEDVMRFSATIGAVVLIVVGAGLVRSQAQEPTEKIKELATRSLCASKNWHSRHSRSRRLSDLVGAHISDPSMKALFEKYSGDQSA
ncbi:hypothetical protein [Mesorhizobium sp. M0965]|uniref:hypothetical protein n=1 Tax=Mesorhizobium sp. M0965 TaxID=2957036 RepID=UPI00333762D2